MPTWKLPLDRPHRIVGRAGDYLFVGGAGDFDDAGAVRSPGDVTAQVAGAIGNIAAALDSEGCSLADVIRLKAFYLSDGSVDEWWVLAAISNAAGGDPPPAITANPVPMQPWPGQLVQIQAIASRGWREHPQTRAVLDDVPAAHRRLPWAERPVRGWRCAPRGGLPDTPETKTTRSPKPLRGTFSGVRPEGRSPSLVASPTPRWLRSLRPRNRVWGKPFMRPFRRQEAPGSDPASSAFFA
jgi:enamine deaminase RidA (YjgF/YER057c/UK114 family)